MENIGCLKIYFYPLTQNTTCMNPSLATSCGLSRAFNIYVSVGFLKKKTTCMNWKRIAKAIMILVILKKLSLLFQLLLMSRHTYLWN